MSYTFKTKLWVYGGEGSWHFATLPKTISDDIREISAPIKRGFGSVKVVAIIGQSKWVTSIFPDSKSKCYILPIKKQIRATEKLEPNKIIEITVNIVL